MARLTAPFSANRSLRQYTEEYYLPLASAYTRRAAGGGKAGVELIGWKRSMVAHWHEVRFGDIAVTQQHDAYEYQVTVRLGAVSPEDVQVELYADARADGSRFEAR